LNCKEIIHFDALIELTDHKHKNNKLSENKGPDHIW